MRFFVFAGSIVTKQGQVLEVGKRKNEVEDLGVWEGRGRHAEGFEGWRVYVEQGERDPEAFRKGDSAVDRKM